MSKSPVILALDCDEIQTAYDWIEATRESISIYKIGLEFFLKFGSQGVRELQSAGDFELFLDLKLHDIPNTVRGAVESVKDLSPRFLTVHAAGGAEMISTAVSSARYVDITAVTVLTSIDTPSLQKMGLSVSPLTLAASLAINAVEAGARAVVCSPLEVTAIRAIVGESVTLITPGVRPIDSGLGDQVRVMTPKDALAAGADLLVIGRPITSYFATSATAMRDRAAEICGSLT
jgi:orotidine-5'-phosphate decarboxylase